MKQRKLIKTMKHSSIGERDIDVINFCDTFTVYAIQTNILKDDIILTTLFYTIIEES